MGTIWACCCRSGDPAQTEFQASSESRTRSCLRWQLLVRFSVAPNLSNRSPTASTPSCRDHNEPAMLQMAFCSPRMPLEAFRGSRTGNRASREARHS